MVWYHNEGNICEITIEVLVSVYMLLSYSNHDGTLQKFLQLISP